MLEAEALAYDAEAVKLIAQAANGSMRDALSLLDQAIAFGAAASGASDVGAMLGVIEAPSPCVWRGSRGGCVRPVGHRRRTPDAGAVVRRALQDVAAAVADRDRSNGSGCIGKEFRNVIAYWRLPHGSILNPHNCITRSQHRAGRIFTWRRMSMQGS